MPYDIFIESEKRPQVTVDADRVEKEDGYINFYSKNDMVASFKEQKVVGYVKMTMQL